jgi:hypothetical protein
MDAEMGFIMTSQTLVSTNQLNSNPPPDQLRFVRRMSLMRLMMHLTGCAG